MVPLQAVGTCMAAMLCFYFMPQRPGSHEQVLQAWLQEFAWTSASMPAAIVARNKRLANSRKLSREPMFCLETCIKLLYFSNLVYHCPNGSSAGGIKPETYSEGGESDSYMDIKDSPMIKRTTSELEAATEGLNASQSVGEDTSDGEGAGGIAQGAGTLDDAMALYNLTDWEVVWDRVTDTKALLAWSSDHLVVAFKGTSSRVRDAFLS